MINVLSGLGYGIIAFAILCGIGIVVIATLSGTVANCPTGYTWNSNGSDSFTANTCCNSTGADSCSGANVSSASTATQNLVTMNTWLGTGSGGLATYIPLVIIITIGLLFLGMFLNKKGKQY
jgi:hypothetical protein